MGIRGRARGPGGTDRLTAAMPDGTGLSKFGKAYPARYLDMYPEFVIAPAQREAFAKTRTVCEAMARRVFERGTPRLPERGAPDEIGGLLDRVRALSKQFGAPRPEAAPPRAGLGITYRQTPWSRPWRRRAFPRCWTP